jgi:phosphatidylserine/phosphatidylglycerophosphate/cardiolipin synthase-like enzyme
MFVASLASALYMRERELDVRFFRSPQRRGLHGKVVIVDDTVAIVGSHNWTHQAFHRNVEASLAVVGPDLVIQLAQQFETAWQHATEEPAHASRLV